LAIQGTNSPSLEVLKGGVEATIQDYPGRLGFWNIGIPPSGPLDDYSFRFANLLVGNKPGDAAIEVAAGMFSMRAKSDLLVAITGAEMQPTSGRRPVAMWESFLVKQGEDLSLGIATTSGFRAYVAVAGGIEVPDYLGSKSTFAAGGFGGYQGRTLKTGDLLEAGKSEKDTAGLAGRRVAENVIPKFNQTLEVEATVGPQAAPDFLKEEDLAAFFSEIHKVDRNANRLGYRLTPRQWKWARSDGGVAGKHPSNIIDNGYTVGSVNVSGDQPIILMRDGPSAGGFVCLCCVVTGSLWKVGQAAPGRDQLKFKKVSYDEAIELRRKLEKNLETGVR